MWHITHHRRYFSNDTLFLFFFGFFFFFFFFGGGGGGAFCLFVLVLLDVRTAFPLLCSSKLVYSFFRVAQSTKLSDTRQVRQVSPDRVNLRF